MLLKRDPHLISAIGEPSERTIVVGFVVQPVSGVDKTYFDLPSVLIIGPSKSPPGKEYEAKEVSTTVGARIDAESMADV